MSSDEKPPGSDNKPRRYIRKRVRIQDEDVGYGKPPKAHQFKPGKSGNPKGRPKGAKSRKTILHEAANHKIGIRKNGKTRRITSLEGIFFKLTENALKGDVKSATLLLSQLASFAPDGGSETEIHPDDKAVLDAYLEERQRTPGEKA